MRFLTVDDDKDERVGPSVSALLNLSRDGVMVQHTLVDNGDMVRFHISVKLLFSSKSTHFISYFINYPINKVSHFSTHCNE